MPTNDREVYYYFRNIPGTSREVSLLAYAGYSRDKYKWMERFEENNNRLPNPEEVNRWISELPESRLQDIHAQSQLFFAEAARRFMEDELAAAEERAKESVIAARVDDALSKVERQTSFRGSFGPNLFTGLVSALLFAFLIILAGLVFERDPSPIALWRKATGSGAVPAAQQDQPTPKTE